MSEKSPERPSILNLKPIAVPKIGHWIGGVALTILAIVFLQVLVTNKNMQWGVVAKYMFNPAILSGLGMTLLLTVLAMVLGLGIGIVLAIMRLSTSRVFQAVSWGWIWFFRGVPPLVQMIFWYNLALLLPEISIGIPFDGPKLVSGTPTSSSRRSVRPSWASPLPKAPMPPK